jgi:hypothetical protein
LTPDSTVFEFFVAATHHQKQLRDYWEALQARSNSGREEWSGKYWHSKEEFLCLMQQLIWQWYKDHRIKPELDDIATLLVNNYYAIVSRTSRTLSAPNTDTDQSSVAKTISRARRKASYPSWKSLVKAVLGDS